MDGGGRLARSLRSLRPDADLLAAARGAAMLLRDYVNDQRLRIAFARRKSPVTPSNPAIAWLEKYLPHRAGAVATIAMLLATVGFGVVRGNHIDSVVAEFDDVRNALANTAGFRISAVNISGRQQLTQDEILALGGVTGRSSLVFLDATTVRDRLKRNPWIADATVLKFYPGRLQIDITERSAFAVWQQDGRLSVIADDGAVLEAFVARRFAGLPLVVGKGANSRAKDFLALLSRYPQIRAATKAAVLVGERRWNLRLKDGLDVRLPENNAELALATLSRLDRDDRILARDIEGVDLRRADRVTVRLSQDAARARDEQFQDKKAKRKANDA